MDNGNNDYNRNERRDTNKTALTILGIIVIALIVITVVTLVTMGKRLWGDATGGTGTVAPIEKKLAGAADTVPSLDKTSPGSASPSTGDAGKGGNTPNPGNILSGAESAGDVVGAGAETAGETADASADKGGDAAKASADSTAGDAAEAGAKPGAPVKDDIVPAFSAPHHGGIIKSHDDSVAVYSLTMSDYRVHLGVDIEANLGDAVYACADGVISSVTADPFMGTCVAITHGNGFVSYYKNLAADLPASIAEGMAVTNGQIIGAVSDTAVLEIADSTHLHFELTKNSVQLNPAEYIEFPAASTQTFAE